MIWLKRTIPFLLAATVLALSGCQSGGNSDNQDKQPYAGWGHVDDNQAPFRYE